MGCDIHIFTEVKENGSWRRSTDEVFTLDKFDQEYHKKEKGTDPFDWRTYRTFGFLAQVRCPLEGGFECKNEIPEDVSTDTREESEHWLDDGHSWSWLSASELCGFNYDEKIKAGEGRALPDDTFRSYLGDLFMTHVQELKTLSEQYEDARVVFWFDN